MKNTNNNTDYNNNNDDDVFNYFCRCQRLPAGSLR